MPLETAANDVRDKVSQAVGDLPPDADPPIVSKADADASPIIFLNIQSDSRSLLELSEIAENTFKERLQTINGVSQIRIWGEKRYAMRLWINPDQLAAYQLTPLDVQNALQRENIELPSGSVEGLTTELTVRTQGRLTTPEEFNNLTIKEVNGRLVRFRDIGYAELGPENLRTVLKRDGDLVPGPYGDVWLRDTGPIFVRCGAELGSVRFRFNGWGKKYVMPGDEEVAAFVQAQVPGRAWDEVLVLEGGSIEVDGEGTLLTTRQCLLEPNRNPSCDVDEIEERISARLGIKRFLWLQDGLHNDHTDGHVDTLARFVAPGEVVCMHPAGLEDPNREVLETIRNDLATMTDAKGRRLRVHAVPSPGEIRGANGELLAASYVNFYIANTRVVVPQYGVRGDAQALAALAPLFPRREIVGSPARALVAGGGAFHCITQQQPAAA
ncbi:MAG: efflux RND transporter permease subunit [Myxococcota bacterium]